MIVALLFSMGLVALDILDVEFAEELKDMISRINLTFQTF